MVMMVWQAELHQGKQSIILDAKKPAARDVIRKAIESADVVLLNKMDNQLVSLGLNRETLDVVNRKAVLLQLKSHQGEKYTMKSNWNGYDPALQGKTGLMTRFGPHRLPLATMASQRHRPMPSGERCLRSQLDRALELRQRGEQVEHQAALGVGGVDGVIQAL